MVDGVVVRTGKAWFCTTDTTCRHVLGLVIRNGSGVRELLLYRQAIDPEQDGAAEVDVIATVSGLVLDVRCSVCGCVRTWVPGEEALRQLVERMGRTYSPPAPSLKRGG